MKIDLQASLNLVSAEALVDAALTASAAACVNICVAVVDRAGHLLAFKRQPGAPLHSIELAQDKAYTAVSFGRDTAGWEQRLAQGSEMLRHGLMHRARLVTFGGGVPLRHEGQVVGAIGISGGSEAQDVQFCEAAVAALAASG